MNFNSKATKPTQHHQGAGSTANKYSTLQLIECCNQDVQ